MASSNFSNGRVKVIGNMTVGPDYQVSCWIQPQNNWDNETNRAKPITTEQYNQINEIVDLMVKNNFQMSVTIRERNEGPARGWLDKMKFKLFNNTDDLTPGQTPTVPANDGGQIGFPGKR